MVFCALCLALGFLGSRLGARSITTLGIGIQLCSVLAPALGSILCAFAGSVLDSGSGLYSDSSSGLYSLCSILALGSKLFWLWAIFFGLYSLCSILAQGSGLWALFTVLDSSGALGVRCSILCGLFTVISSQFSNLSSQFSVLCVLCVTLHCSLFS